MAMSLPLIQGHRPEWALLKAHESETQPPTFSASARTKSKANANIVYDYNQSHDLRFGAQIAANKPWVALKATEILTTLLPRGLRLIDLNVGCPIDLVYREGAGSALMDSPGKLEKILCGMNAVSNEVPITAKIRTGTKDGKPTAQKLIERLVLGDEIANPGGASGVAAVTLHGRSRQQRYTREANWEYIAETAGLIRRLNEKADRRADTVREVDERELANPHRGSKSGDGKVFFLGNGDVYSHEHYTEHIAHAGVDTCMVARGALMKPWIFEEIEQGQYLDKSSSQRLEYVEKFCRYGLEAWGSDEIGVGQTRRFLLEWLSFACRYVPVGLLERLPPSIQDRPPRYRGRDELETLMASDNFRDWIKIRYVLSDSQ
jgi:tRNA-dihydrouridine synthase 3